MSSKITLKVGSYNIKCGDSMTGFDMSLIADDINSLSLDIVGLQEIDDKTERSGGRDVLKLLAEAVGFKYYRFVKSIDYRGGGYGTGIISRYPIVDFNAEILPHSESADWEARAFGIVTVDVCGERIKLLNTHFSLGDASAREAQFARISEAVRGKEPFIITGDFNTDDIEELSSVPNTTLVNAGKYKTFFETSIAIDEIILDAGWSIVESGMKDSGGHSDHNMLWAEVERNK